MKLREYQKKAVEEIQQSFKKNQRTVLTLPTGSGKTVIFSNMVELAALAGSQTLVLTHRTELFEQTFKAIDRLGVNVQRIEAATKKIDSTALVSVAMVETIERRIKKGFAIEPKLIIIDEAHFGNFTKLINHFENSFVIGVTATPVGKHFFKYYTKIVEPIRLSELIEQNFLCDYVGYQMQDDFSNVKKSKGEFDERDLFNHFDKPELYLGVVSKWKEKCLNEKTVVFCCNIEHAENTTESFNLNGITAKCISSRTSKEERANTLQLYKEGAFNVLVNCGILTTGWDEPSLTCVVVNRATMSLPLWLQMCGRGSRTNKGKEFFTVLDFGKNHDRHGMWSEDRMWKLEAPKIKKEGAPPTKECPKCGAMCAVYLKICKQCGHEFKSEVKDFKDGILVQVQKPSANGKKISELTVEELIDLQIKKIYKAKFIWRVIRSNGWLNEYAKKMNYTKGWIWHQEQETDSKYTNFTVKIK
jgi:superfamily II DNA or RNA helicase